MPTRRYTQSFRVSPRSLPIILLALACLLVAGCDKMQIPEVTQQAPQPVAPSTPQTTAAPVGQASGASQPGVANPVLSRKELVAAFYQKAKNLTITDRDIIEVTREGEPGDFDEVQELRLGGAEITDAGVTKLGKFTKLASLDLGSSAVALEGMQVIKELPELRSIGLSSTKADDRIMLTIGAHPSIREVRISSTAITDFGVNELEKLKDLEWLDISHTRITGSGFQKFRGHKQLKTLIANNSGLQSEALKFLTECPMERLEIDAAAGMGDAGMQYVGKMKELKHLSMSFCNISDVGIKKLGVMKNLEYINVRNDTNITGAMLFGKLRQCKNLKYANVNGTRISATECAALMKLIPGAEVTN